MMTANDVLAVRDEAHSRVVLETSHEGTWMCSSGRIDWGKPCLNVEVLSNGILAAYCGDARFGQLFVHSTSLGKLDMKNPLSKRDLATIVIPEFLSVAESQDGICYFKDEWMGNGGRLVSLIVAFGDGLYLIKGDMDIVVITDYCAIGDNAAASSYLLLKSLSHDRSPEDALRRAYSILSRHVPSFSKEFVSIDTKELKFETGKGE